MVLHGLLGSARNWLAFCRAIVRKEPRLRFVLFNLPGHGLHDAADFPQAPSPASLASAADNVLSSINCDKVTFPHGMQDVQAMVGHSMGGRVLMQLCEAYGGHFSHGTQVAALDTMPGPFDYHKHDVDKNGIAKLLEFLASMPELIPSRAWLQQACLEAGFTPSMTQWISTNLAKLPDAPPTGPFRLAVNVKVAKMLWDSHRGHAGHWGVLRRPPAGVTFHQVMATGSSRWQHPAIREQVSSLRSAEPGSLKLHTLAGGHWLHVDNPRGLVELLLKQVLLPHPSVAPVPQQKMPPTKSTH